MSALTAWSAAICTVFTWIGIGLLILAGGIWVAGCFLGAVLYLGDKARGYL